MDQNNIVLGSEASEINIKAFLRRIWENKLYFLICVPACMAVAYLYTKYAPPTYEVATSMLMDVSASS
ncbi:MAG: Wzz/FepE/Etk N-terminal domain-containing protein, partial [Bacteroidota bacterium]